jgi:carbonic anhydrase
MSRDILPRVTEPQDDHAAGFADLLRANAAFAEGFTSSGLDGVARRGVGIVTCMDSRINPLGMLGLQAGDAKILRDMGARVSEEVMAGLVIATNLLGVRRILLVAHTRCTAVSNSQNDLRDRVGEAAHADASWMSFRVVRDQAKALREDVAKVRSHPLMPRGTLVGGFIYDVDTGRLRQVH